MDIHYTDIDEAIKNKLAQLHLNEEWYEAFHDYFSNELKKVRDEKLKEKAVYDEQIKKLKRDYFDKKKYNDLCIICQNNFKDKEKVIVISCKHCFHEDCIVPWLKNKKQCPFCKSEVIV
jgi:transcriptional antiterminator